MVFGGSNREWIRQAIQDMVMNIDDVFEKDVLNALIKKSGGLIRWFIKLILEAVTSAKIGDLDMVTRESAQEAIDIFTRDLTAGLTLKSITELRQVRRDKRPSGSETSSELLNAHFIVAYNNGETWFDAHPLIWNELQEGQ